MGSALPYRVVSTALFLLSAALLFVFLRRRVGDWPAVAATAIVLFLGAAWEDLLWSFQMTYFGSMAAGLGALLALERGDRRGEAVACALLVVSVVFGSLGLSFAIGAAVYVLLLPERRRRLYVFLVPLAVYALWWLGWGHDRRIGAQPRHRRPHPALRDRQPRQRGRLGHRADQLGDRSPRPPALGAAGGGRPRLPRRLAPLQARPGPALVLGRAGDRRLVLDPRRLQPDARPRTRRQPLPVPRRRLPLHAGGRAAAARAGTGAADRHQGAGRDRRRHRPLAGQQPRRPARCLRRAPTTRSASSRKPAWERSTSPKRPWNPASC